MPTYTSGKDVVHVFVGGYDIASSLDTLNAKLSAVTQEFKPLGQVWPIAADTGTRNGALTVSGLLDSPNTDSLVLSGTGKVVSALVEGETIAAHVGPRFFGFSSAAVSDVEVTVSPDQVHGFVPGMTVNGRCNYGYVVAPYTARTTGGDTKATYITTNETATGGIGYLHVGALSLGASRTGLTVTLTSSPDHTTWTDNTAFANVTAIGAQTVNLATVVYNYVAMIWAWVGGTPGAETFTGFVGVSVA